MNNGIDLENSLAMAVERIDPVGPISDQSVHSGMCPNREDGDGGVGRRKFGPIPQRESSMNFAREKKIILGVAFGAVGLFVVGVGVMLMIVL